MRTRATSRRSRSLVFGGLAAAGLSLLVVISTALGNAEDEVIASRRAEAAELVDQARDQLTFDLLTPAWLPEGYSLEHIAWFPLDELIGSKYTAVDAWYSAPGRPIIHVWQTDNPDLGRKDPIARGEPVAVTAIGVGWSANHGLAGRDTSVATELSARLPGGVTVTVDGGVAFEDLVRVVKSLRTTPAP
jgi:hypothetical protein